MKKYIRLTALIAASLFLYSCGEKAVEHNTISEKQPIVEKDSPQSYLSHGFVQGILQKPLLAEEIEQQKEEEGEVEITPTPTPQPEPTIVVTTTPEPTPEPVVEEEEVVIAETQSVNSIYSPSYFMQMGVIYWGNYRWTWYSERILPGYGLNIPGRYTNSEGYVCDGDGYICLASSDLSKGTIVDTPFGYTGKVYDSGCASGTLDVYVGW